MGGLQRWLPIHRRDAREIAGREQRRNPAAGSIRRAIETGRNGLRRLWWNARARPRQRTIERVKQRKEEQRLSGAQYNEAPRVSVVIQSFNQVRNIAFLESRLRATCMHELIVCEDGSLDGSLEEWVRRLTRPNDFLIRSNDLHEIRTYDRAIDLARGEVVCLMQDDDRPPRNGEWLAEALQLFEQYPSLAILGGWVGFMDYFATEFNSPWLPGHGVIPFEDPKTGRRFMFVENVNIGPYLLRKRIYNELGGFDPMFSEPGAPGICFESELCYRAWERGYQVGLTDLPVKAPIHDGYPLPGGTLLWGKQLRERNEQLNKARIIELHGRHLAAVQAKVEEANRTLRQSRGRLGSPASTHAAPS